MDKKDKLIYICVISLIGIVALTGNMGVTDQDVSTELIHHRITATDDHPVKIGNQSMKYIEQQGDTVFGVPFNE